MLVARRCLRLPKDVAARSVHSTSVVKFPRKRGGDTARKDEDGYKDIGPGFQVEDMPEYAGDDTTTLGHIVIEQKKQILKYMRLIERDGPRLQIFQKPFVPPPDELPLIVRAISYSGEDHPVIRKQVIVVAVSKLPLQSPEAIHKVKLLAGPRWSQKPPRDSGVGQREDEIIGEHGYIKVSCEEFPEAAMNLNWGSDVIDNLITEANNSKDSFADVPHDQRHIAARVRKHRKGDHIRGRPGPRPTLRDFPKEWLPEQQPEPEPPSIPAATQ